MSNAGSRCTVFSPAAGELRAGAACRRWPVGEREVRAALRRPARSRRRSRSRGRAARRSSSPRAGRAPAWPATRQPAGASAGSSRSTIDRARRVGRQRQRVRVGDEVRLHRVRRPARTRRPRRGTSHRSTTGVAGHRPHAVAVAAHRDCASVARRRRARTTRSTSFAVGAHSASVGRAAAPGDAEVAVVRRRRRRRRARRGSAARWRRRAGRGRRSGDGDLAGEQRPRRRRWRRVPTAAARRSAARCGPRAPQRRPAGRPGRASAGTTAPPVIASSSTASPPSGAACSRKRPARAPRRGRFHASRPRSQPVRLLPWRGPAPAPARDVVIGQDVRGQHVGERHRERRRGRPCTGCWRRPARRRRRSSRPTTGRGPPWPRSSRPGAASSTTSGAVAVGVLQPRPHAVRRPVAGAAELGLEAAGRGDDRLCTSFVTQCVPWS